MLQHNSDHFNSQYPRLMYTSKMVKIISSLSFLNFVLLSTLVTTILTFVVFYRTTSLSFTNDDWIGLYGPQFYPDALVLFSPYGVQLNFFHSLYFIFGLYEPFYYLLAILLRALVPTTILLFVYFLTNNRFASFISALIFTFSFSGIQTITEPNNMIGLAALAFAMLYLIMFFFTRQSPSFTYHLTLGIYYLGALFLSPVRMFPLVVWSLFADLVWLLTSFNRQVLKMVLIRQIILLLIFLFLFTKGSFGITSGQRDTYLSFFTSSSTYSFSYLIDLLTGIGNVILPDILTPSILFINMDLNTLIGGVYLFITLLLAVKAILKKDQKYTNFLLFLVWIPIFYILYSLSTISLYSEQLLVSFRRYLTVVSTAIPILIGLIIAYVPPLKGRYSVAVKASASVLLITFISIHILAIEIYLEDLTKKRNFSFSNNFWIQLKALIPSLPKISGQPTFFYIESSGSDLENSTFIEGFSTHASFIYQLPAIKPTVNPQPIRSLRELKELVETGLPLKEIELEPRPVSWDRIYAFRLEGGKLQDIKEGVKRKLQ